MIGFISIDEKMDFNNIDYSKESMLVVDDDEFLRETLEELVATLGFSVESAPNGQAAITILENKKFTFLLTDMKMPGMDGLELIEKVLEWTIDNMQDKKKGYFYFQLNRKIKSKIPYIRWGQAWMMYGMSFYILNVEMLING